MSRNSLAPIEEWHPPERTHGPTLFVPREGRPGVYLRIVDRFWPEMFTRHLVIDIDGGRFTVTNNSFSEGSRELPEEVRTRLEGILPDWDNRHLIDDRDFWRQQGRWDRIQTRLTADYMLWLVVTFLVTEWMECKIDREWIERNIHVRETGSLIGRNKRGKGRRR